MISRKWLNTLCKSALSTSNTLSGRLTGKKSHHVDIRRLFYKSSHDCHRQPAAPEYTASNLNTLSNFLLETAEILLFLITIVFFFHCKFLSRESINITYRPKQTCNLTQYIKLKWSLNFANPNPINKLALNTVKPL